MVQRDLVSTIQQKKIRQRKNSVPSVPRYNPNQIEQQNLPQVRVRESAPIEAFGGGDVISKPIGAAQNALRASEEMFLAQKKSADSLVNQESDFNLHKLHTDIETEGLSLKGKDAAASLDLINSKWRKGVGELESKLNNDDQRAQFRKYAQAREASLYDTFKKHTSVEISRYDDELTKSSIDNYRQDAISNFKDPSKIQLSLMQQEKALFEYSQRKGESEEVYKNNLNEAKSKTHSAIISRMVNTGDDLLASKYYKQVGDQLTGTDKAAMEKILEEGSLRGESQRKSDMILNENLPMTDSLEKARQIEDPKLRDEVVQRVKQRFQESKMAEEQDIENLHRRSADVLDKTPNVDAIPREDWARFSVSERESLRAYAKRRAEGSDVETDWNEYYNLKTLASEPSTQAKFQRTNLFALKNKLGNTEFKELVGIQADLRKGSKGSEKLLNGYLTARSIVDDGMRAAGIDPTPKEGGKDAQNVALLRSKIDQQVVALQQQTGKEASNEDIKRITDNMLVKVVTEKGIFWDTKKRAFELEPNESGAVDIEDVPRLEREKITKALLNKKIPVTDDNILRLYTRKLQSNGK